MMGFFPDPGGPALPKRCGDHIAGLHHLLVIQDYPSDCPILHHPRGAGQWVRISTWPFKMLLQSAQDFFAIFRADMAQTGWG